MYQGDYYNYNNQKQDNSQYLEGLLEPWSPGSKLIKTK